MENIYNHLDLSDDERGVLLVALANYLQFCTNYGILSRYASLCKTILFKLGSDYVIFGGVKK